MAARFVRDEEAAGSNPATPTKKLQVNGPSVIFGYFMPCRMSDFGSELGADLGGYRPRYLNT